MMEPLAELRTLISRHAVAGKIATPMAGVRLMACSVPTEPIPSVAQPALAVVAQGAKRTVLGDQVFEYGAGQYLMVSVDLPINSHVVRASGEKPFLAAGLTFNPAMIATLLLETAASTSESPEPLGMGVADATTELLEAIVRLLRLLDRPQDVAVLRPMIEREVLWRLLTSGQGYKVRQIGLADSRMAQVSHAIRWIREHYAEVFRIEDLAKLTAMSASSLHRHFRAVTAMSPLQFQKQIRLQEARARLLAEPQDVAAVGHEVGYDSPSQFSREYSRLFGAPPGEDAARLRATSRNLA
jgi:AraC-like DNA-binding protein